MDTLTSAYPDVTGDGVGGGGGGGGGDQVGVAVGVPVGAAEKVGEVIADVADVDEPFEQPIRIDADMNTTRASKITAVIFLDINFSFLIQMFQSGSCYVVRLFPFF